MMKYRGEPLDEGLEQIYVNNSFARYKTIIQEQYALAKNDIDFQYSDSVSFKERQLLLEVIQEFLESTND